MGLLYPELPTELARRDMPPPGGYANIKYKRNLPIRGVSGAVLMGGVALICGLGFYRVGQANVERRSVALSHIFHLRLSAVPWRHAL